MGIDRRSLIRTTGAIGITSTVAGCLGGIGGSSSGNGGDSGADEGEPVPDDYDSEDGWAEEWREFASERAAEELGDDGSITFNSSFISDPFDEAFLSADFEGPYEPLTGSIEPNAAGGSDHRSRYPRLVDAGESGYDLMDFYMDRLVMDDIPVMDVSNVPGFVMAPEGVTFENWRGGRLVWARSSHFNRDVIGDPPETWDDVLDIPGEDIIVNYTPNTVGLGAMSTQVDDSWWEALGEKEGITVATSGLTIGEAVSTGEKGFCFIQPSTNVWNFEDGGIEMCPPGELHHWVTRPLQIGTTTDYPWASKLAYDFLMNSDHTDVQSPRGGTMALDLETSDPPEFADLYDGKIWTGNDIPDDMDAVNETYRGAVGEPTD